MAGTPSSKRKFEEMHIEDVFVIMIKISELIYETGGGGIADFAARMGKTPLEVWPIFCAEADVEQCEPWPGYPDKTVPREVLEKLPGADPGQPMPDLHREMYEEHQRRLKPKQ